MHKKIERKLSRARFRLALNTLIEVLRRVFLYAGGIALAAVAVEKMIAIDLIRFPLMVGFIVICSMVIFAWWLIKIPSRKNTSLLIDKRVKLKERMSSLIAFESRKDPFSQAACQEASEKLHRLDVSRYFPILFSRNWFYSMGMWLTVVLMVVFLPQYDLMGNLEKQQQEKQKIQDIKLAEKTVELSTSSVKLAVKQIGDKDLESQLDALEAISAEQSPEAVKRQAIQKLGNLSDKIKQLESGLNADSLEITKQMLKQLKPMSDAFSQTLQQAVSKGDWDAARDMINQFQKQLEQGQLSDQQKQEFTKQLENLSKQLEHIAAQNKALEDELSKLGLDQKLANLSSEELRKLLQKQGLSPEQIEQLLQKMTACKVASSNCSNLAQAMAACSGGTGGLSADALGNLSDQFDGLDSFQQQMDQIQASLAEIESAMNCLGQGVCQGMCAGLKSGNGNGGGKGGLKAGTGIGNDTLDDVDTSGMKTLSTKVKNQKQQPGPMVASWYFKGEQVKGESSKELHQIIKNAEDNASDAISENEIPKRYEESVKNYFGGLADESKDGR